MFLKSLTIKGFKSFAEPTMLDFEPGVTVVVGPNGSGKSNIVDAVAWVLGAQGPRALRSSKMDDVIFAGSGKRPALGRAEVSLTIDNTAELLPIAFTEVTITRTLFRSSGESEYAINGVSCRLLDVFEVLSESGVGRTQHVIVSHGQLDSVLNARSEDRRTIVEEAAGVLKYRRRREKAQRRLESTEGNLLRLQDLLREVRRQLRPLERQAEAARRHGDLVDELSALRLHLAGREIAGLESRLESLRRSRDGLGQEEVSVRGDLGRLDADVLAAEAEMTAASGSEAQALGDAVGRLEGLRERARGLAAVLAERRRSVERDLRASVDQGVVASLEADAARLTADLEQVEEDRAGLAPRAQDLASEEAALNAEREAFEDEEGGAEPTWTAGGSGPGSAAEVRGELAARRAALERDRAELARLESRLGALQEREARLEGETEHLRAELGGAEEAEAPLVSALVAAERRRAEAEDGAQRASEALRGAEHDQHAWAARAEALALALDEARARAGAERLAGVAGVVGTLVELVEVDAGWEAAFEAAAGEAVAAVVVDGVDSARVALGRLREAGATGAVLPSELAGVPASLGLPAASVAGAEPVRAHVRSARAGVERLLDGLLGAAVAVGGDWTSALEVERRDLAVEREGMAGHVAELSARLGDDETRVQELESALPALEAQDAHGAARRDERRAARSRLGERASALSARRRDFEVREAGLDERWALLARRLEEIEDRLRDKAEQRQQAAARRHHLESVALATDRLASLVADRAQTLEAAWAEVRERRRLQQEAVRARAERL